MSRGGWRAWARQNARDHQSPTELTPAALASLTGQDSRARWIARELIPYALDWCDRERLWPLVAEAPTSDRGCRSEW